MMVSGFFSLIVYRGFMKELGYGFYLQTLRGVSQQRIVIQERSGFLKILPFVIYPDEIPPQEYVEIIDLAKRRFALQLLIINGGIFILAGTAGYFLAGKTLHPIELMVDEQESFVADASHELRTPLTSIKTGVEVALRDKKLKLADAKALLKSNLIEVDNIKNFTDHLLTLSRLETKDSKIQMEDVDLMEVIRQAVQRNEVLAKDKKIKIVTNLTETVVRGNPHSLIELISIFVNNAIKYSPAKTEVNINLVKSKKKAIIEIKDQGIGIAEKDIPHIFDRFFRADSSRSKEQVDGYGLGLSIAKSIADVHKGKIKVESKLKFGSKFTIVLPA